MNDGIKYHKTSYSLWLMPELKVKNIFQTMINQLAKKYGGPVFEPHITLLSSFKGDEETLLKKTEILSQKLKSFKINFKEPRYLNEFFRSLFIAVDYSPELKIVRNIASKQFIYKDKDYIPHLSLMYGNYSIESKKKIIFNIKYFPRIFKVNKIYLAHNNEIKYKWRVIRCFKLKNE